MPFTGTPVIKQISDSKIRVTGTSLGESNSGTIGLFGASGSAPDITLPASFDPEHYTVAGASVPFQDCLNAVVNITGGGIGGGVIPSVVKTGTTRADFRMTFTDIGGSGPDLEIVISFH